MKITLSGTNRLALFSILPLLMSETCKDLLIEFFAIVRLTEVEMSGYPNIVEIDVKLDEKLSDSISKTLTTMYETGMMTDDEIDLYKIFVGK
jgi:hypothetical protein